MKNLKSKLKFYKLIPYLVDKRDSHLHSPQQILNRGPKKGQTKGRSTYACACAADELGQQARAQLKTFFSTVCRDWQCTGLIHLSNRLGINLQN